jgi:hypothetical protein
MKIEGFGSASGSGSIEAWIRGSGSGSTPKCHGSGTLKKTVFKALGNMIRVVHFGSGSWFFTSWIRNTEKDSFQSSRKYDPGCSFRIRILIFTHPGSTVKKAPDPGSGSATLNISIAFFLGTSLLSCPGLPDPGGKGGWALAFHFVGRLLGLLH